MSRSPARRGQATQTPVPAVVADSALTAINGHELIFAEKPLLAGEEASEYDALLLRVVDAVRPRDAIDAIWVRDIVDLLWEAQRLRRWKARLLMIERERALRALLEQVLAGGRRP